MTAHLAQIWRHPVKAHGRERIDMVTLEEGKAMPWDRVWAIAHERSCFDVERPGWNPPGDFSRGASSPRLQQIECMTDPAFRSITFFHPDRPALTINPADHGDGCEFIQWVMPISLGAKLLPSRFVRAPDEAMTDTGYQSISLMNLASHRALEGRLGREISSLRWRGNFLVDGLAPWEEFDLIGNTIRIGKAEMEVVEPVGRCRMTEANPETGKRDADTLGTLREAYGHSNFGIYLKVTKSGHVQEGDQIEVLT
ncbi:MOSC domain-containing protein [Alisedimentitalea sp. MJ-SS2]|uniref:MOSC domain-containing protein n=1 Tax=Aliisedimentitalea sp. MJ-SS2 TaxID=3049795 RepID=UPI0029106363|nr:MOSC domain-containing protein [Alisedimentitalea sp. MJ-SS2]MDU8928429.1 MOSC domain-containing protein [Alisedimentitalea sp. MJ-SS2]